MTGNGGTGGGWTDAEILQESARWVYVPPAATRVEDGPRLLALLPAREGPCRVWRSWPERSGAEALILDTIERARTSGGTRLVWHTGDGVSSPFMDELLAQNGFEQTENLDVLAFELGANPGPILPALTVPPDVRAWTVEDAAGVRRAHAIESVVFPASAPDEPDPEAYLQMLSVLGSGVPASAPGGMQPRALRSLASVSAPGTGGSGPVSTAGAELAGRTLRLWGAGTLPAYRGRGAYRSLVVHRCRYAHALGATLALTKANTATSAPMLRAAGFRRVANERRHTLKLSGLQTP